MGKELPSGHHFESMPSIGGYGIYGEPNGGFEQGRSSTLEEEQRLHEAIHGKDTEDVVEDPGFVVIQATSEQEAIHRRVIAAQAEQIEGFEGLKGSIFDLPNDKFGIEDEARIEKVIVDFSQQDYRKYGVKGAAVDPRSK